MDRSVLLYASKTPRPANLVIGPKCELNGVDGYCTDSITDGSPAEMPYWISIQSRTVLLLVSLVHPLAALSPL